MAKKYINSLYMIFIILAILIPSYCFYLWNNPFSIPNQLKGLPIEHVTIEQCNIQSKHILIKGWGYIPNKKHSNSFLYVEKTDGSLLPVEKTTENRQDRPDPFHTGIPYNILGFIGSKKLFWPQSFTHTIFITMKSEDGQTYLAQHICQ